VLLLLLEGSFLAGAAALTRTPLLLPVTLTLAEWTRGEVPFGGLPMGGLALGQAAGPLAPAARLGGALLVTTLAVLVGVAVTELVRRRLAPAAGFLALVVALVGIAHVAPDGAGPGPHRVLRAALVQGGGIRGLRAIESDPSEVLLRHLDESRFVQPPVDLVLWPENVVDVARLDGSPEEEQLAALARAKDATVVAGVTQDVGADRFDNVAVAWAPDGRIVDRYTKAHRVPFGEYVPLRSLIAKVADLSVLPRDAVPGKGPGVLRTPAGTFGVSISYEVFFSARARAGVRAGGQLLLVPTNAASFTTSQVPTQEVATAQLRAIETGRWVLQAAPTGYGAVVDPAGRLHARTVLSRPQVLTARPRLRSGRTIYVRTGDVPLVLVCLAVLVAASRSRSVMRSGRQNGSRRRDQRPERFTKR